MVESLVMLGDRAIIQSSMKQVLHKLHLDMPSVDEKQILHLVSLVMDYRLGWKHLLCENQSYVLNGLGWQVPELRDLQIELCSIAESVLKP